MSKAVFWLLKAETFLLYRFCSKVDYWGITESSWKLTFGRGTKLILKSATAENKELFHIRRARLRFSSLLNITKIAEVL